MHKANPFILMGVLVLVFQNCGGSVSELFKKSDETTVTESAAAEACRKPAPADADLVARVKAQYPGLCRSPHGVSLPYRDGSKNTVHCSMWLPHGLDNIRSQEMADAEERDLEEIFGNDFISRRQEARTAGDLLLWNGNWEGASADVLFIEETSGELKAHYKRSDVLPLLQSPALDDVEEAFRRSRLYTQYGGCEGSTLERKRHGGYVLTTGAECEISNGSRRAARLVFDGSSLTVEDHPVQDHRVEGDVIIACPIM